MWASSWLWHSLRLLSTSRNEQIHSLKKDRGREKEKNDRMWVWLQKSLKGHKKKLRLMRIHEMLFTFSHARFRPPTEKPKFEELVT